jgi:hypothetical protein
MTPDRWTARPGGASLSKDKCVRTKDQIAHGDILTETTTRWNSSHTNPPGGLANYYRNNVIGGPGAFVMVTENFNSFGNVLVKRVL